MHTRLALFLLITILISVPPASASSITYTLNASNLGSTYPGPYGTVNVDLTGTTATVTFTSAFDGTGYDYLFGAVNAIALNISGTFTYTDNITYTQIAGASAPSLSQSSGNVGGAGSFDFILDNFDGWTHALKSLSFTFAGSWATAADVLTANGSHNFAAAHVFACAAPCSIGLGAANTGFAFTNSSDPVPEPATMMLIGTGLIMLVGGERLLERRKRR